MSEQDKSIVVDAIDGGYRLGLEHAAIIAETYFTDRTRRKLAREIASAIRTVKMQDESAKGERAS